MTVALYRRFRPGRFGELRGQPHVAETLRHAVATDRVTHAYLFSGPRGTGKTSTARILAKALNCADPKDGEPCGECRSCVEITAGTSMDVHELDAASNNGVDAVRDLISHAALGTPGRWKVYIVDEVHMLTPAASNALLKTLEEPPGHVIFVLATTDPQKVAATIRSRTQHFEFRLLGSDVLASLVREVNESAGLALDEGALASAVRRGKGSARDTLSALDQVAAAGSSDLAPELSAVIEGIIAEDPGRAFVAVSELHEAGWGSQQLAGELVEVLRQAFLSAVAPALVGEMDGDRSKGIAEGLGLARLVRCIELLGRTMVEMRDAPDARVVLEIALVRLAKPELDDASSAFAERLARVERLLEERPRVQSLAAQASGGASTGKPTIGALRRMRESAPAPTPAPPSAPAPAPTQAQAPVPALEAKPGDDDGDVAAGNRDERVERQGKDHEGGARIADPTPKGDAPDRDRVVQAWGDHVYRGLPARAKALFSAGRFIEAGGGKAIYALPNAAHRDACEEVRPIVEGALSSFFGVEMDLALEVEGRTEHGSADEEEEMVEAEEVVEGDAEAAAEARVKSAFPGAEEI